MSRKTDNLIESLTAELKPVRALRFREGVALVLASVVLTVMLVARFLGLRDDVMAGEPAPLFLISNGLFLMLGLAAATSVVMMGNPQVGNRYDGWKWALATAGLLPLAAGVSALASWSGHPDVIFPQHDPACVSAGVMFGGLTALALIFWLRRGAPASPARAGLLTGIAVGAIGTFADGLCCPLNSVYHLGFAHSVPVAICALLGRIFVPPLVRW
ncbi:MAG: DUF1109 domain-containing protein [Sphingomonadaceae bacterium]|jgi:hypothetical protein